MRTLWTVLCVLVLCAIGVLVVLRMLPATLDRSPGSTWECRQRVLKISDALSAYAQQYGQFPDDLRQLVRANLGISHDDLICPRKALRTDGTSPGEDTRSVSSDSGFYVYIGAGKRPSSQRDTVILYEPLGNHPQKGGHVLFSDGWVSFMDGSGYLSVIQRSADTNTRPR